MQQQAFATPIAVLMMFLGLVLLLACANIATLMLARGARRQREMSVRLALGAGRGRILRQMLVESLLLATIGGLSGLALAYAGRGAIAQYTPHFDWQVFGFTAAITIVTGLLFGFAPAFAALRTEIADSVKRRHAIGRSVVGFQIALATLLVIGDILSTGPLEIVGVCGDTLYGNLHESPPPQLFIPYSQQTQVRRLTYMIRTQVAPETIVPALRKVLHAADPALPLVAVRTQQAQIDEDLADERLLVSLSSIFGVLALVLASVGIYGVMALSVAQRTREIGIRMALGAIPRQILAMVLREASTLSVIAIAIGVGASILSARFVKSVLFGIGSSDLITLSSAAGLLLIVALGASWIPARRAAHVHPMEALRRE
jgi:ABC-type antimicrobial peptide transport system permease subunit